MIKYVIKRILLMLMVFMIIISVCFVLVKLLPSKPAEQFGKDMALIEMRRELLGYNKPLIEQYFIFIQRSLIGMDWGISETLYTGQDVWTKFMEKMPATVIVNVYTMIFAVPLGASSFWLWCVSTISMEEMDAMILSASISPTMSRTPITSQESTGIITCIPFTGRLSK